MIAVRILVLLLLYITGEFGAIRQVMRDPERVNLELRLLRRRESEPQSKPFLFRVSDVCQDFMLLQGCTQKARGPIIHVSKS
jgi:hypothetical protein